MLENIFEIRPLVPKSFLQRVLGQQPKVNALYELNNLLARNKFSELRPVKLKEIELRYGVDLAMDFPMNLQEIYAVVWNASLKYAPDAAVDAELTHLKGLLRLDEAVTGALELQIGAVWYDSSARTLTASGRFPAEAARQLDQLRRRVKLPQREALLRLTDTQLGVFKDFAKMIGEKKRCSPDELERMRLMLVDFELSGRDVDTQVKDIRKFKVYWDLEHLPLPAVDGGQALQRSETCHLVAKGVSWGEERGSGYHKAYEVVNRGSLYLTNKRLVFEGDMKNSVIPYDRIRGVNMLQTGLLLLKDKGKNPVLFMGGEEVPAGIVLKRLI